MPLKTLAGHAKAIGRRVRDPAIAVLSACLLVSCAATGGPFGLSKAQQQALGEREHPNIVAAFGGEVADTELRAYVDQIVRRLLAASDRPQEPIKATVLDSPVVNAMALPGHVYVTRGLLALANSEAELAGVLGHEIGHVFEQHTAERVSRSNIAGLGAAVIGILTGSTETYQIAAQGAQLYLLKFSRSQEYEADLVGVRLLAQAGYDPLGEAQFLNTLNRWSDLEAEIAGQSASLPEFLSTHPNTAERVERAATEARVLQGTGKDRARDRFLAAIDDMVYGDDPRKQGFVRDNAFFHPELAITFTVPADMTLSNSPQAVIARGQNAQMQFGGASSQAGPAALISELGQQLQVDFGQPRRITVAGRPGAYGAARGNTSSGQVDVQLYAVQWQGASHYYFLWVTAANATGRMQSAINGSVQSLRSLSAAQMQVPPALRIEIEPVQGGDTVSALAARTAFETAAQERFMIINGLQSARDLTAGQRVKLVR